MFDNHYALVAPENTVKTMVEIGFINAENIQLK